jgi:hypothetical protein
MDEVELIKWVVIAGVTILVIVAFGAAILKTATK